MFLLAFLLGIIAGLRSMTPLAALSWAAYLGWLPTDGTWLGWLHHPISVFVFTATALGELVADKLPMIPSRTELMPFATRVVVGAFCGAALGTRAGSVIAGVVAGVIGAVIGTVGGAAVRKQLAEAIGKDLPAALLEDLVALGGALLVVLQLK
jgi:uncharacterized membrane protein